MGSFIIEYVVALYKGTEEEWEADCVIVEGFYHTLNSNKDRKRGNFSNIRNV